MTDPQSIHSFGDNDVIIPLVVFEELDKHKLRFDETGRNARKLSRMFDEFRVQANLFQGIQLSGGTILKVSSLQGTQKMPPELAYGSVDNLIILYMLELRSQGINGKLITKDVNMRLKCDSLGIQSEDYVKLIVNKVDDFYTGVSIVTIDSDLVQKFYDDDVINLSRSDVRELFPHQIVILNNGVKTCGIARCTQVLDDVYELRRVQDYANVFGLKPRNKEQNFSFELLLDPNVKLLTITGRAGSGKSLLALAAGLQQLKMPGNSDGIYEKIVISRPIQPLGRDLGYLRGTLEEKLDPWIAPIKDHMNFLMRSTVKNSRSATKETYLQFLQQRGLVEIEAITYIRGRSIANAFMVVDEAQNLSVHELKTIVTRIGEGSKIVLTGDWEQIDNSNVDIHNNAMTYAAEMFKKSGITGHITLIKGERSPLATLAAEIL